MEKEITEIIVYTMFAVCACIFGGIMFVVLGDLFKDLMAKWFGISGTGWDVIHPRDGLKERIYGCRKPEAEAKAKKKYGEQVYVTRSVCLGD